jgi:hypothetical protein
MVYGKQIYDPTYEKNHDCIVLTPRNTDAQIINNSIP